MALNFSNKTGRVEIQKITLKKAKVTWKTDLESKIYKVISKSQNRFISLYKR